MYADTSGVRRFDYILEAVKRAGPHKILFGSDGPWLHPGAEIHKVRLLGLPPEKEALILGGNILRLFNPARIGREAVMRVPRKTPAPANGPAPRPQDSNMPPGTQLEYVL